MDLVLNKNNRWVKSSMFMKRVNGFMSYAVWAFISLVKPIEADKAMYISLKGQFIEDEVYFFTEDE